MVLVEMWRRFCLVSVLSVVLHQQDQDEGRDAEDQAGEGDHDGRDDLLDPDEWGDDGVRLYGENRGEVGVEGLEPCHRAQISTGQQSLQSEGVKTVEFPFPSCLEFLSLPDAGRERFMVGVADTEEDCGGEEGVSEDLPLPPAPVLSLAGVVVSQNCLTVGGGHSTAHWDQLE